jgi:uncharacterized membrane protein YfhO
MVTHARTAQVLRLRLTDLPGWHGTIDGQPLSLAPYSGVMMQARIPAGVHTIEVSYWPEAFSVGIFLAVLTALSLVGAIVIFGVRRRRRQGAQSVQTIEGGPSLSQTDLS